VTATLIETTNEADWLAARRKGISASEIAVVLGLSPWSSPFALYHQKTGDLPGQEDNMSMAIGRHFEGFVAGRFAERHPELLIAGNGRALYAHPERPWQIATPDRLLHEGGTAYLRFPPVLAVLECKTDGSFDGWGEDGTDEIPVHYRCQVLWQMDVLGVQTGFVACLFMHRRELRVYELTMDDQAEADLDILRREGWQFYDRLIQGREPDVDWRPATATALKQLYPGVEEIDVPAKRRPVIAYQAACKAFEAAKERKGLAENRLRLLLGDGHRITDERSGEVIARRDVYDVKEHTRKGCHVDKLVPVKTNGEKKS